jgi:hypothetical protein
VRWVATLFVVGCRFGAAVPVHGDAMVDAPVDTVGSDVPRVCPNGYTASGSHCLVLNSANNAWANARTACQVLGADLAWPPDAATLQAMTDVAQGHDYWIGISDPMNTGVWVTVSGANAPYLPWGLGEPKSTGACVRVHKQGSGPTFITQQCDNTTPSVCDLPPM